MTAKTLIIKKLYGYFDKTIEFNNTINLLVGINGSGKTSVLNVLNWLLTPSFPHLCVTQFESLFLTFSYNLKEYSIQVTQTDKELTYLIVNHTDDHPYYPLTFRLKIAPRKMVKDDIEKEKIFLSYVGLTPDANEEEAFNLIANQIPKPIVIGLDRFITPDEHEEKILGQDRIINAVPDPYRKEISPLDEVKRIASREYNIYKNKVVELNRILNNNIMLSAFDAITPATLLELESVADISISQVESLHKKVESFFKETISETRFVRTAKRQDASIAKIDSYFNNLKKVIIESQNAKEDQRFTLLYLSNISQFRKLKELIREFEEFE